MGRRQPLHSMWLLACIVLAAVHGARLAAAQQTIAFSWTDATKIAEAPSAPTLPPEGCSCLGTASPCTEFECACVCNRNIGMCDQNCCCDAECSEGEIARFQAAGTCLPTGATTSTITFCEDLSTQSVFSHVNPTTRMKQVVNNDAATNLMCVAVDNNPSKGEFFVDTGLVASDVIDNEAAAHSFKQLATAAAATTAASSYLPGANVVAATTSGPDALNSLAAGFMPLPSAAPGGACAANSYAQFATAAPATSQCLHSVSSLSAQCSEFDAAAYVDNLRIGKTPSASLSQSDNWVSVTKGTVKVKDLATGALTDHGTPSSIAAAATSGCVCNNAVLEVAYALTYNSVGTITAATADLVVANVTCCGSASCSLAVAQTFSASWTDADATATAGVVARPTSGNPGYINGAPVLAGYVVRDGSGEDEKTAIAQLTSGLTLRGPSATGACSASGSAVTVGFGRDAVFGCTVSLTRAQLQALCTDQTHTDNVGVTPSTVTHLGTFGNSNPIKPWDWLAMDIKTTKPTALWTASTSTCSSVATSLHVELLTALMGDKANPQRRVVSARASFGAGTWQFTNSDAAQAQEFVFQTTVTFVESSQSDPVEFVPPAPPILQLDHDVFYPFQVGGADADETSAASPAAARPVLACMLVAMLSALASMLL